MEFRTISYLSADGTLSKECKHNISQETVLKGYKAMEVTRQLDERMVTLQRQGTISFAIGSNGEEACAVASSAALEIEDWLYPQYREIGSLLWRGFSIEDFLHNMFCNAADLNKGRQMPNHFGSKKLNVVTVGSCIATQIPHAAGCAYAMKIQGENTVSLCYFGDGASSEGDFHAGMNFAAVTRSPVIFFCRNNGYAISTKLSSQFATDGLAIRGPAYGMETFRVDGNDFFAVHEITSKARKICLEGKGPVFIEAMTYRCGAHSTSDDPSQYRSNEELSTWQALCPIARLRKYLYKQNILSEKDDLAFREETKHAIDRAIVKAREAGPPALDTLISDVYFEIPQELYVQFEEARTFSHGELS